MISADFGVRVRAAREAAGLSQAEVARQVGINRMYYSLFEAGRYVPSDEEGQRIAERFKELAGGTVDHSIADRPTSSKPGPSRPSVASNSLLTERHEIVSAQFERANMALDSVQASATKGLRSKTLAQSVSSALDAVGSLEYSELLALSNQRRVDTAGLLAEEECSKLDVATIKQWESRAIASLVCESIYGSAWSAANFDQLKRVERQLRHSAERGHSLEYRERSVVEILFGDAEDFCAIRRVDLAPYVVARAIDRDAPMLA
jgi:transcriptional regulator with XRE-family HTH domain